MKAQRPRVSLTSPISAAPRRLLRPLLFYPTPRDIFICETTRSDVLREDTSRLLLPRCPEVLEDTPPQPTSFRNSRATSRLDGRKSHLRHDQAAAHFHTSARCMKFLLHAVRTHTRMHVYTRARSPSADPSLPSRVIPDGLLYSYDVRINDEFIFTSYLWSECTALLNLCHNGSFFVVFMQKWIN